MPTYQYACTECGDRLEVKQAFTDEALTTCPACAGQLRKMFNAVGVVFKGSGFYRTDSRAAAAKSDGDPKVASEASSNGVGKDRATTSPNGTDKQASGNKPEAAAAKKPAESTR